MTIYQALRILSSGRKVCFTNHKVDGKFDLEKALNKYHCTRLFDPEREDTGRIFSYGVTCANIIIVDEDGSILVKEAFTPTPQEKEECARYHRCDFYSLTDNQEIPFVRRRKPKDTLEKIADKIDEYIVRHNLRLDDPDEDEYGQCVSSFMLADALADIILISTGPSGSTRKPTKVSAKSASSTSPVLPKASASTSGTAIRASRPPEYSTEGQWHYLIR